MPKYLLTGVDGQLSSIAASHALGLAQPGDQVVLTSPRPGLIAQPVLDSWAARGAQVLMVDYDDPRNLARAFAGVDAVAFVSSPNFLAGRRRRAQHRNVVEAARAAGVGRLVYTSLVGADAAAADGGEDVPALVRDHAFTEDLVRASGLAWNIQRNSLFADTIAEVLPHGCGAGGGDDSRAALVAREDCGRVLGALLMGRGAPGETYAVTGPRAASGREIAAWVARQPGRPARAGLDGDGEGEWEGEGEGEGEVEARWRQRRLSDSWGRPTGLLGLDEVLGLGRLISSGYLADETDAVVRLTGRAPLDFAAASLGGVGGLSGLVPVAGAGREISC